MITCIDKFWSAKHNNFKTSNILFLCRKFTDVGTRGYVSGIFYTINSRVRLISLIT